jgi:N-acetylmuramoyl-L-alanine amidase
MRWTNSLVLLLAVSGSCWGQKPVPVQPPKAISSPAKKIESTPALQRTEAHFTVVLDAAHGGSDPGARLSEKIQEKDVTLALSTRLRSALAARGIAVVTTREQDTTVTQQARAETANRAQAAVCLLLHASNSGIGVHLFVSPIAPMLPTKITPWNSAQGTFVQKSLKLAGTLNGAFTQASVPVTLARAAVLPIDNLACPAVAIEVSPLPPTGGDPQRALDSTEYQSRVAEAIVAAILEWRNGEK